LSSQIKNESACEEEEIEQIAVLVRVRAREKKNLGKRRKKRKGRNPVGSNEGAVPSGLKASDGFETISFVVAQSHMDNYHQAGILATIGP